MLWLGYHKNHCCWCIWMLALKDLNVGTQGQQLGLSKGHVRSGTALSLPSTRGMDWKRAKALRGLNYLGPYSTLADHGLKRVGKRNFFISTSGNTHRPGQLEPDQAQPPIGCIWAMFFDPWSISGPLLQLLNRMSLHIHILGNILLHMGSRLGLYQAHAVGLALESRPLSLNRTCFDKHWLDST